MDCVGDKVVITIKKTNAKYAGKVNWIDDKTRSIQLINLWILNKDYSMKVASKSVTWRIFNLDNISKIEFLKDVNHLVKWSKENDK